MFAIHRALIAFVLLGWACLPATVWAAAKPSIAISLANWSGDTLSVRGQLKNFSAASVDLRDGSGRLLGQAEVSNQSFEFVQAGLDRPELLCSIQVETSAASALTAVKGRMKSCAKVPECKILKPSGSITAAVGEDIVFSAKASLKDKSAKPLRMEWDFAGGALGQASNKSNQANYKRPTGPKATVHFIRDNGRYRVRFTAWDKKNNYCEDAVEVVVGSPPDTAQTFANDLATVQSMATASAGSAPKAVDNLRGQTGDKVVVPFEDRSMQCGSDSRILPDAELIYPITASSMKAYVYEKGLRPVPLGSDQIDLRYAAASNPSDPAGGHSINSTSQNWPADAPFSQAVLQKGELFERYQRPEGTTKADTYRSWSLMDRMNLLFTDPPSRPLIADEGPFRLSADPIVNADQGNMMPGVLAPYAENATQPFGSFAVNDNWFSTLWLPLTDIDDSGRVNPTSLFRVQAVDTATQTPVAATDITLTSGRDVHCRGCHAKGKIGANADITRSATQIAEVMWMGPTGTSLADQEFDAVMNTTMLHAFYDDPHMIGMEAMMEMTDGIIYTDGPAACGGSGSCHSEPRAQDLLQGQLGILTDRTQTGSMSNAMHRLHGSLQYNNDKSDILRDRFGRYLCGGDYAKLNCAVDPARSLFPVRNPKTGKILPMEENCLKCHSGEREQCYRDRMYTAGVTCYQCHGDMLAVAGLYEKPKPNPDGNSHRLEWLDQPDCGSCHTGSGNRGKAGKNGYFSPGVKTLAFDEKDPSATPTKVDLANPDERRFAITPLTDLPQPQITQGYGPTLKTALYRMGKDRHGQVACAACHGAAHAVWPNRNPNANDNVTALELQGHTGHLLECNVCHTADSFAKLDDLDEGLKVRDAQKGVLGGPHNLHPISDPYWWKAAPGDTENSDHTTSGGWHNNVAKVEGADHEDQCAACHGNDHKGTRLSKTPVDRVFDFSDAPDLAKLQEAGIKTKVVVKAGTPIGCNTCHSIRLSCTGSRNSTCGQTSDKVTGTLNQTPTVNPPYTLDAVIGQELNYSLTATDPEQDSVSFDLTDGVQGLSISAEGNLTVLGETTAQWSYDLSGFAPPGVFPRPPFTHEIKVMVGDDRGAYAMQPITLTMKCPDDLTWDNTESRCRAIGFTEWVGNLGIEAGKIWTYTVPAISATGATLSFSLTDPVPPGMTIDANGRITFNTRDIEPVGYSATVNVTDPNGNEAQFYIYPVVCKAPMRWNPDTASCIGAVHITSSYQGSLGANSPFSYQVVAKQDKGKPVSFSLINAPAEMTISEGGLIGWNSAGHEGEQVIFQVEANDNLGSWARQDIYLNVCPGDTPILTTGHMGIMCSPGPITIVSTPPFGASAGGTFTYQVETANTNGLPVTLSLQNPPEGMTISGSGLVTWNTTGSEGASISFGIIGTDTQAAWVKQTIGLTVCPLETPTWDNVQGTCLQ